MSSDLGEHSLVVKFRNHLLGRGAAGIKSIGMYFRQVDDNRNGTLCMNEFRNGLLNHNIRMKEDEVEQLFRLFDRGLEGTIDYDEFLLCVRVSALLLYFWRLKTN